MMYPDEWVLEHAVPADWADWVRQFSVVADTTWMVSWPSIGGAVAVFLGGVAVGSRVMRHRSAFSLRPVLVVHNAVLCLASLSMLVIIASAVVRGFVQYGFVHTSCDPLQSSLGILPFMYWVNYLFKFYEFLDTMLLVLRKRPTPFLHVYHHAATALLAFVQLRSNTSVQWLPIGLNLMVHVLMYYYYMMSALGVNVWWKKHLTSLQIIQFVLDLVFCYWASIRYWGSGQFLPDGCYIDDQSCYIGLFILSSYLLLFVQLFYNLYIANTGSRGARGHHGSSTGRQETSGNKSGRGGSSSAASTATKKKH